MVSDRKKRVRNLNKHQKTQKLAYLLARINEVIDRNDAIFVMIHSLQKLLGNVNSFKHC